MAPINATYPINESVWIGDGPPSDPFGYWVETGLAKGAALGSTHEIYWAVETVDGHYNEHDNGGAWTYGTNYDALIFEPGLDGHWQIDVRWSGGEFVAAVQNPQNEKSYIMQAGLESGDSTDVTGDTAPGLMYYGTGGNPNSGWSDSSHHATIQPFSGNTSGSWNNQYTSWHSEQNGPC